MTNDYVRKKKISKWIKPYYRRDGIRVIGHFRGTWVGSLGKIDTKWLERPNIGGRWYHAGKLDETGKFVPSERLMRMSIGRDTGWTGTGIYLVSSPGKIRGARTIERELFEFNDPWKKPLILNDWKDYDKLRSVSKLLRFAVYDKKLQKTALEITKKVEKDFYYTVEGDLAALMGRKYSKRLILSKNIRTQKIWDHEAMKETFNEFSTKYPHRYVSDYPQPINLYLQKIGYDGIMVEPKGDLDTTTVGSVVFCNERCKLNVEKLEVER